MKQFNLSFLFMSLFTPSIFSQNVGIEVPVPLGKLHIKVNSSTNLPQLRLTEQGDDFARIKMESDAYPGAFWDIAGKAHSTTNLSLLNFYFSNATTSGDRLTITGLGNVGIGNSNPLSKLDITSIGDGNELLRFTTDRPWVFKQKDSGPDTKLVLQTTTNVKDFEITSSDGVTKAAVFRLVDANPSVFLVPENGSVGIGTVNPLNKMRVEGSATSTQNVFSVGTNYVGNSNIRAIEGYSTPANGFGEGGYFQGGLRGIYSEGVGGNSTNHIVGVYGNATGTGIGIRSGIFGTATGGSKNFAGYFSSGHVYITNELRIGADALDGVVGYKVAIDGKIIAEEVRVQLSGAWPDYVFDESYQLKPLHQLKKDISELGHLPGVPSAEEVKNDGILLGDMNRILLEKIEELTLYTIGLQQEIEKLKADVSVLKSGKK